MSALDLLTAWLERQADPQGLAWLAQQRTALRKEPTSRALSIALGLTPRKVGKAPLNLTPEDLSDAERARPRWNPRGLTIDQAARIVLLLEASAADDFPALLKSALTTADMGEQIAVHRGLPLYANPERLVLQAIEGLRSAVRVVFESVAHDNPFPAEQFTQDSWNQMVLKALFLGATLDPIVGLDERWNPDLARMLVDTADERSAAGRPISPELWRGVGPFADEAVVTRLAGLLAIGSALEKEAAALALSATDAGRTRLSLDRPDLATAVASGEIGWRVLGDRLKSVP